MRIILYTGKGGVGKTSVSAATAVRAAQHGYRTIVMSTDLAHSLADSLDVPLGPEPVEVAPNLWAQETDVYHNLRTHWGSIQEWLRALLAWRQIDDIVADEVSVLPGMEELANLLWINRHRESGDYDLIIVDCAPTGETLRLLSFPEIGRWWVEKILPIQRAAVGVMRPIMRVTTGMPMPTDDVYTTVQELFGQLDRLHRMLVDPELDLGAPGDQPREDGHQRGAANLELLQPVRLPQRPDRAEPAAAGQRGRQLLHRLEADPVSPPRDGRRALRARADQRSTALSRRGGGPRTTRRDGRVPSSATMTPPGSSTVAAPTRSSASTVATSLPYRCRSSRKPM